MIQHILRDLAKSAHRDAINWTWRFWGSCGKQATELETRNSHSGALKKHTKKKILSGLQLRTRSEWQYCFLCVFFFCFECCFSELRKYSFWPVEERNSVRTLCCRWCPSCFQSFSAAGEHLNFSKAEMLVCPKLLVLSTWWLRIAQSSDFFVSSSECSKLHHRHFSSTACVQILRRCCAASTYLEIGHRNRRVIVLISDEHIRALVWSD